MHVKQVSRGLAILVLLITAAYMLQTYGQFPDQVPMQWDLENEPTWHAGKTEVFGYFAAGLLVMTCLFCFIIPLPTTSLLGFILNLEALFAFHLIAAQVLPDPLFHVPVDIGTYILLGTGGAGFLIAIIYGLKKKKEAPPAKEA